MTAITRMARAMVSQCDRWLIGPAPPTRLAMFRILTGLFALAYLVVRLPVFLTLTDAESSDALDPVGVLWWLDRPINPGIFTLIVVITLLAGAGYTIGFAFRVLGPLFAIGILTVTTYRSSWGQLLWFENLLVLHVLIVAVSRAGDALAFRKPSAPRTGDGLAYGWPLRLAGLVTVITYMMAGVAKLRIGGLNWVSGESLRNHVAYSATRLRVLGGEPSVLARPLMDHTWLFAPMAVATMALELGGLVALTGRTPRMLWVAGTWFMHVAIALTMNVVFPYPLALIAFAPLFHLEDLLERVRAGIRRRAGRRHM